MLFTRKGKFLGAILVAATLIARPGAAEVSEVCRVAYSRLGLDKIDNLSPEQVAKWERIRDFFSSYFERRLSRLSPEVRRKVEERLLAMELADGLGRNRAVVVDKTIRGRIGGRERRFRRRDLGAVFFNRHLMSENLYSLLTMAHELEHIVDAVTIRAPIIPSILDSFRPSSYMGRTERRAFGANFDVYREMRESGIKLEDFLDVMLALDSRTAARQDEFMKLVIELRNTEYGPSWLSSYKELIQLVRLDSSTRDQFINVHLNDPVYRTRMSEEIPGRLKRLGGLSVAVAIGALAGISQVDLERMWSTPPQAAPAAPPPLRRNEYASIPGRWDEAHLKQNGFRLEVDFTREAGCANLQDAVQSPTIRIEGIENFLRNQQGIIRFNAGRADVVAISLVVFAPSGQTVFARTFSGRGVSGSTTLAVPGNAMTGTYRVRGCEFFKDGRIESSQQEFQIN